MEYIIKSDSYRLLKTKINELLNGIDKENITYYDLLDDSIKDIIENANYVSLFNDKKGIVVYNSVIFGTKYEYKEELSLLEKYLENSNNNTILIFITDSISTKKRCVKIIQDKGNIIELKKINDKSLNDEIKKYLNKLGFSIENSASNILINRCNSNYDLILNEIDKLLIVKKDKLITIKDIEKYTNDNTNIDIFNFVDNIIKKRVDVALKDLHNIIENIEPAIIFSNIASQYRLILCTKNLIKEGLTEKQIADEFLIHPYRIKLAHENSFNYSFEELENKLLYIGELDKKIKIGQLDKNNALKLFILNI